jgi:hypothetical protein
MLAIIRPLSLTSIAARWRRGRRGLAAPKNSSRAPDMAKPEAAIGALVNLGRRRLPGFRSTGSSVASGSQLGLRIPSGLSISPARQHHCAINQCYQLERSKPNRPVSFAGPRCGPGWRSHGRGGRRWRQKLVSCQQDWPRPLAGIPTHLMGSTRDACQVAGSPSWLSACSGL